MRGRLLFSGEAPAGWACHVAQDEWPTEFDNFVDSDGRFVVRSPDHGEHTLEVLHRDLVTGALTGITDIVDLKAGRNEWNLDLPTGSVTLEGLDPLPSLKGLAQADDRAFRHDGYGLYWRGRGQLQWMAEKWAGKETTWKLPAVPAGTIRVTRLTRQDRDRLPRERHVDSTFTLAPGEKKTVKMR